MKLIKFEPSTTEDEIFKKLRGKSFLAISAMQNEEGIITYTWHTHEMISEVALFGAELVKKWILEQCE